VLAKRNPRAQFLRFVRQLLARLSVCALAQGLNTRVYLGDDGRLRSRAPGKTYTSSPVSACTALSISIA